MRIGIAGTGAFGTALAISLAANGGQITLWGRNSDQIADMAKTRTNAARLPGQSIPKNVSITAEFGDFISCDTVLLAVPMQQLRPLLTEQKTVLDNKTLVACCKGVELNTHFGPAAVIGKAVPSAMAAILTGPSFAHDIAAGLPTALTLACEQPEIGSALQAALSTPNLRLYRTTDVTGAELGGALKNVIAIACGVVMGAGLGESARAALMTRGYAEMQRMAQALGARPETLAGLSGFGDLALTCTSAGSRNYRFGAALGRAESFDTSITVEGAATARAVLDRATEMQLDMPITQAVTALQSGKLQVAQAMEMLLSRPLKEE